MAPAQRRDQRVAAAHEQREQPAQRVAEPRAADWSHRDSEPGRLSHGIRLIRCISTTPHRDDSGSVAYDGDQLRTVCAAIDFYGLAVPEVEYLQNTPPASDGAWCMIDVTGIADRDVPAVVAWVRASIDRHATVIVLGFRHDHHAHISLLNLLTREPDIQLNAQPDVGHGYRVPFQTSNVTGLLAGACVPWTWPRQSPPSYFQILGSAEANWISLLEGLSGDEAWPYLLTSASSGAAMSSSPGRLLLSTNTPYAESADIDPDRVCPAVLAALLLVRMAAGNRCWHRDSVTANFTIDDPNLVEPYGRVSFNALARSMRAVGYHTTVAFIPWNHRRTSSAVEALFAREPRLFSLAVHGNDHDGYEFAEPSTQPRGAAGVTPATRVARQRAAVAQALTRMRALTRRTGLPFSPVMVFPHGIGSADSILQLERCGYLASANRQLVPSGSARPHRFDFGLSPADDTHASFPLMQRWWPADVVPELAAFLGKPLLLYAHERDFAVPLWALEKHVARIQRLNAAWLDLTGIARSLYLERDSGAGETQIRMLCREVDFINRESTSRQLTFFREQPEAQSCDVSIDGMPCAVAASHDRIVLRTTAAPGQCVRIRIERRDAAGGAAPDRTRAAHCESPQPDRFRSGLPTLLRVALRRHVCDMRDRYAARLGGMIPNGSAFTSDSRRDEP
jgi:hypothetical protein